MISSTIVEQTSTIQASVAFSQNRNGSSTAERDQVQQRGHQLAGDELPHLVNLADLIHRLAGRVAFEVIQRQPDQPGEDVQIQLGVGAHADHGDDQAAGKTEQRLVSTMIPRITLIRNSVEKL